MQPLTNNGIRQFSKYARCPGASMMIENILIEFAVTVIITVRIDSMPVDLFLQLAKSCDPLPKKTVVLVKIITYDKLQPYRDFLHEIRHQLKHKECRKNHRRHEHQLHFGFLSFIVCFSINKEEAQNNEGLNGNEQVFDVDGRGQFGVDAVSKGHGRHYELELVKIYLQVVSEITQSENTSFPYDLRYLRNSDEEYYHSVQQTQKSRRNLLTQNTYCQIAITGSVESTPRKVLLVTQFGEKVLHIFGHDNPLGNLLMLLRFTFFACYYKHSNRQDQNQESDRRHV